MDKSTIAVGIVLLVVIVGVVYVASQSPAVAGAVGFGPGIDPARDNTAADTGAVLGGIGTLVGGLGTAIGSIYGGGIAAGAGGTSKAGVAK